jgi:7,8-didemethyl-8-hydroxy-5-deazariboflavin synthase
VSSVKLSVRNVASHAAVTGSQVITYSPAFTLVPTYECFNRCTYCNFRTDLGQSPWLTLADAQAQLAAISPGSVCEILILSGEVHPQSAQRTAWFEHIYQLCELAISMGFLPHTNVGPLHYAEMERLKKVNVSLGLMLEQMTPHLQATVHQQAPSKNPALRWQQLEWAGQLHIPFTTGLLLGIGETMAEQQETLEAIATLHQRWGHIQEVILQPYRPGHTAQQNEPAFSPEALVAVVTSARQILPSDITIQIPPNLLQSPQHRLACLNAGARDFGGIVPHDHVNPDYTHTSLAELTHQLAAAHWRLQPRLPVYPHLESWVNPSLQPLVQYWREYLGTGKLTNEPINKTNTAPTAG